MKISALTSMRNAFRRSPAFVALLLASVVLASCSTSAQSNDEPAVSEDFEARVLEVLRDNPEVILESVQAYQQQQEAEQQQARQSVVQEMAQDPAAFIGDSPIKGAESQEIVLLEFSDFQCPFCARASTTVDEFMAEHGDRVTLAYKHLPLVTIHDEALPSARASWAAQQQGKFWEYHDALFANQERLGEELYVEIAEDLELDREQFDRDRESDEALQAIQSDLEMADRLGLSGTPAFFLNGEPFSGAVSLAEMEAVLERVVARE